MCTICYNEDNLYSMKTSCGHSFHVNCLQKWWYKQIDRDIYPSCPMCRFEPEDEEYNYIQTLYTAHLYMLQKNKSPLKFEAWIRTLTIKLEFFETAIEDLLWAPEFYPVPSTEL